MSEQTDEQPNPHEIPTGWTPERVEQLIALRKAGHSYSVIAAELGTTASAVTGKLDRLGMIPRRGKVGEQLQSAVKQFVPRAADPYDMRAYDGPNPRKVPILELEHWHCRWPINLTLNNMPVFCGCPKIVGSYCGYHARVSYRRPHQLG